MTLAPQIIPIYDFVNFSGTGVGVGLGVGVGVGVGVGSGAGDVIG